MNKYILITCVLFMLTSVSLVSAQTPTPNPEPTPNPDICIIDPTLSDISTVPHWPIHIINIDKEAESVTIKNMTSSSIDLSSWSMCSLRGNQHHPLPPTIAANAELTIVNQGGPIWLNTDEDPGALWSGGNNMVSYFPSDLSPATPVPVICEYDPSAEIGSIFNPNYKNCQPDIAQVEASPFETSLDRDCSQLIPAIDLISIPAINVCINWVQLPEIKLMGLDFIGIVSTLTAISLLSAIMRLLRA